ncbi:hypothetical protein C2845_PM15G21660 [Panicum miliaceum]|uniref:Secreted protein n=1 Tax=Panicum miliaceum TaxID=4540 RepID=A0A3L6QAR1_PANMI|nr:hypothetical protein C2845_PM15G21660 [Panicum miliaceum]
MASCCKLLVLVVSITSSHQLMTCAGESRSIQAARHPTCLTPRGNSIRTGVTVTGGWKAGATTGTPSGPHEPRAQDHARRDQGRWELGR